MLMRCFKYVLFLSNIILTSTHFFFFRKKKSILRENRPQPFSSFAMSTITEAETFPEFGNSRTSTQFPIYGDDF